MKFRKSFSACTDYLEKKKCKTCVYTAMALILFIGILLAWSYENITSEQAYYIFTPPILIFAISCINIIKSDAEDTCFGINVILGIVILQLIIFAFGARSEWIFPISVGIIAFIFISLHPEEFFIIAIIALTSILVNFMLFAIGDWIWETDKDSSVKKTTHQTWTGIRVDNTSFTGKSISSKNSIYEIKCPGRASTGDSLNVIFDVDSCIVQMKKIR